VSAPLSSHPRTTSALLRLMTILVAVAQQSQQRREADPQDKEKGAAGTAPGEEAA